MWKYKGLDILNLTNRLIPTATATCPAQSKAHEQPFSTPKRLPRTIILLLSVSPPPRLTEPFQRYIIQFLILHPKLTTSRPKVLAIPHDSQVERITRFTRKREAIDRFALREAVEPEEVHQEPTSAPCAYTGMAVYDSRGRRACLAYEGRVLCVDPMKNIILGPLVSVPHLP
jgi:hypothetical protein